MTIPNYDPNARYDEGPHSAGSNGVPPNVQTDAWAVAAIQDSGDLSTPGSTRRGLNADNVLYNAHYRAGFSAAGNQRANGGPNVAGSPRSYNNS